MGIRVCSDNIYTGDRYIWIPSNYYSSGKNMYQIYRSKLSSICIANKSCFAQFGRKVRSHRLLLAHLFLLFSSLAPRFFFRYGTSLSLEYTITIVHRNVIIIQIALIVPFYSFIMSFSFNPIKKVENATRAQINIKVNVLCGNNFTTHPHIMSVVKNKEFDRTFGLNLL